jgi:PhnB protein
MKMINPYLNFDGNTEEAFNFYKSVFGGEFSTIMRFGDTPEAGNVSERDKNKIMHIALPLGNRQVLMGTDACESMGHQLKIGNNSFMALAAESEAEAHEFFSKLSVDGNIQVPIDKMFWGGLFGQLTDKFDMQWMITFDKNM